jgi:ketosteroid isomerase-like protein
MGMSVGGETEQTTEIVDLVEHFNNETNRHDLDAMMALTGEDIVFESTLPPDGERFEGQGAVRACWEQLFRGSPNANFETEEVIVSGDRCTVRWRYAFDQERPDEGHVRGVDVFRVANGKIVEKLSYVKG